MPDVFKEAIAKLKEALTAEAEFGKGEAAAGPRAAGLFMQGATLFTAAIESGKYEKIKPVRATARAAAACACAQLAASTPAGAHRGLGR